MSADADTIRTLEEMHSAAFRCWKRVHAAFPESDPLDPEDPSVSLDTLAAILHATLASLQACEAQRDALRDFVDWIADWDEDDMRGMSWNHVRTLAASARAALAEAAPPEENA